MEALEAIATRHGVLRYRPDPVEPDKIQAVLEAAIAAPSPANLQPWAFVVVTDPGACRPIARYLVDVQEQRVFREMLGMPAGSTERLMGLYESFDRAPCFILLCLEQKASFARPEHEGVLRQWHLVSLGAAMQSLMIAATALRIGHALVWRFRAGRRRRALEGDAWHPSGGRDSGRHAAGLPRRATQAQTRAGPGGYRRVRPGRQPGPGPLAEGQAAAGRGRPLREVVK